MDAALILCRALHYTAAIALFGVSVFQATAAAAILVVCVTTLLWLLLEAAEVTNDWIDAMSPATISALLFETEFGRVWQWRLGFAATLLAILVMRRHDNWRLTAFSSALVLASLGFVGHGAMHEGAEGWVNLGSHTFHLLAAGLWLGSLVPLLACLPMLRHPVLGADAAIALRRFSRLGAVAVATVLITGVANTWLVLKKWPIDFLSPYQTLLLAKIGLVAAMIGSALVNRFVLTPRLGSRANALGRLRANTLAEVALGIGAIVLVSILAACRT